MNALSDNDELEGPFGVIEVDFCDEKKRYGMRSPVFEVRFPVDAPDMPESLIELCATDERWYTLRFRGQKSFKGSPIQLCASSLALGQETADFADFGPVVVPEGAKWMIITGMSRLPLELRLPQESEFLASNPLTIRVATRGSDLCESYTLTRHGFGLGDDYSSPCVTTLDKVKTRIQLSKCIAPSSDNWVKEGPYSPYHHLTQKEAIAVLLKMVQSQKRNK